MNRSFLAVCFSILVLSACVRKNFKPVVPSADTTQLWQAITIADLKAIAAGSGLHRIERALVFRGVVVAHDKSGNLYKQIIVDDGTAAIPVLLDAYNLYADFPLGRELQIYCRGLTPGLSARLPQLGYAADSQGNLLPIPARLISSFIKKGKVGPVPQPVRVLLREIRKALPELYSRVVVLDSVAFADTGLLHYAEAPHLSSATNVYLRDCDSNLIVLRTSAFADFAAVHPPSGKGRIQAVYSVYNTTPQLLLLDTADIRFNQKRCP